jgi:tRNA A37 threonylcarbamoyltransferase TsaD
VKVSVGVTCNSALRRKSSTPRLTKKVVCADNAAMEGVMAEGKLLKCAATTPLDAEIGRSDVSQIEQTTQSAN